MPHIIAHRGASADALENTRAAFRAAVAQNADGIELDVHGLADGGFAVHHDPVVAGQTLAGLGRERLAELVLANGETVPSLDETLRVIGPDTDVWVEVKSLAAPGVPPLLETLAAGPAPARYRVHAFDHRIAARVAATATVEVGVLSSSYPLDPVSPMRAAGATTLWQLGSLIDDALVATVHDAGLLVIAWTVDEPHRIRALAAAGVDGICTNRPAVAREVLS